MAAFSSGSFSESAFSVDAFSLDIAVIEPPSGLLGGRDKAGAMLPVHASLAVVDDPDMLAATVYCAHGAALLHSADRDDVLQAVAAVAWPQARLVIESVRLLRAPAAPKMVRQMALIRDN